MRLDACRQRKRCASLWTRLERGIVAETWWAAAVWLAAVFVAATFVLISWALAAPIQTAPVLKHQAAVSDTSPPEQRIDDASTPLLMEATGYSQSVEEGTADGITASGLPVARGMAAADPAVLRPGTVILVSGYGYAMVGDVGSAIEGDRLDLFFSTREEAFAWGRRTVAVRVVRP